MSPAQLSERQAVLVLHPRELGRLSKNAEWGDTVVIDTPRLATVLNRLKKRGERSSVIGISDTE